MFTKNVEVIYPTDHINIKTTSIFNESILNSLECISKELLKCKDNPDLVSLGFWLRKTNLTSFKTLLPNYPNQYLKPIGTVLHICPSNVDTMFVYSLVISMLCGNYNIIKLPSITSTTTDKLLNILIEHYKSEEEIYFSIIKYPNETETTKEISSYCNRRIIWGGDFTVNSIKVIEAKSNTIDIPFTNKRSSCILNSKSILLKDTNKLNQLVRLFYNDFSPFNQKACSSPSNVFFLGTDEDNEGASRRFWGAIKKIIPIPDISTRVLHQDYTYNTLADLIPLKVIENNKITVLRASSKDHLPESCGNGLFFEHLINQISEIYTYPNTQTITYSGLSEEEKVFLASTRACDRIVPVGLALSFYPVWDSINLLEFLTKRLSVF